MIFGCHVSIRNGYLGAAKYAQSIKAKAFQYFPKNPRSLIVKDFDKLDAGHCKELCREHNLLSIAHTPYPTSLTPADDKREAVIDSLINDLQIAEACGSVGVVVHYGSHTIGQDPLSGYRVMIEMLDEVLKDWDGSSLLLLENNAGKPGSMGTTLEELVSVRSLSNYSEKIGFCLDTCHAYASGLWNGDNWHEVVETGEKLDYFSHLKAIHFNNSIYPSGEGKDRHANIFKGGCISETSFQSLMDTEFLKQVPFILETPSEYGISHEEELQQLYDKWN
ncbi:deoxyribonuclease IV [Bacillus lacus]|uniref:Deoxyribonuclease IV n=2 Tax=Metabacillus lacus TaxID=1983721 RepID=A0A7X2LX00_9BACI|nr:deoxyribonuclease IV [Metabacillus lacus]